MIAEGLEGPNGILTAILGFRIVIILCFVYFVNRFSVNFKKNFVFNEFFLYSIIYYAKSYKLFIAANVRLYNPTPFHFQNIRF
jgi:hypothetical protein